MSDQPEVQMGQLWQECDQRFERFVRVISVTRFSPHAGTVLVRTYTAGGPVGRRVTRAKLSRFNGKRGGYRYVSGPEGA